MKAVCKKLFSLMLVAILLVSAVPFQVFAEEIGTEGTTEVIETTEATAQVVAEIIEDTAADDTALFAANPKPTGEVKVFYQLEDKTQVGDTVTATMSNRVNSMPNGNMALQVYAQVNGDADGMEFVRWYYKNKNGEKITFDGSVYLHEDMDIKNGELDVFAQIELASVSIRLDPAGGTLSTKNHLVKLGKTYNEVSPLPSPTAPQHYNFLYWVRDNDRVPVNGTTIVPDYSHLTAFYGLKDYNVTFMTHNGTDWVAVSDFTFALEALKTLSVDEGTFPRDAQINSLFTLAGWNVTGWEYTTDRGETWKEFKVESTKIQGDTAIRPVYKRNITLHANDKGHTTRSLEVTLGKKLPVLPHPGTREGFAFDGWYLDAAAKTDLICSKDNLSNVSAHPVAGAGLSDLYAGWSPAKTVYLYIHTNGNTKEHTKLVRYYDVSVNGFNLKDVDLYEIFPNYGKYDDKGDEKWGWYDAAQWENFCLNKHKYETTEVVNAEYLSKDDVHEFYIMLNDNGNNNNGNNYNDNKNTVDSSNPTTGDDIFVAVTIMAVSACALLLFFMNKKRFAK